MLSPVMGPTQMHTDSLKQRSRLAVGRTPLSRATDPSENHRDLTLSHRRLKPHDFAICLQRDPAIAIAIQMHTNLVLPADERVL